MVTGDPHLRLWTMELIANVFLWTWLFCMGATVGSFLNVVVYRLPRGKNLAFPGSLCPHCGHPIRLQDNIPILSWLNLRGRCRDCGGGIAASYLLVELTVAILFLVVLAAEFYLSPQSLGLPVRELLTARDGAPFWCMYFLHVSLLTTLLGATLMMADKSPVPAALFAPAAIVALVIPLLWPSVRSVPAFPAQWMPSPSLPAWQIGLVEGAVAVVAGVLTGVIAIVPARLLGWRAGATVAVCCLVTLVLGWQRGVPAAILALLVSGLLAMILARKSASPSLQSAPPESP
jgi:leader peptidase (prepilin peptidase) / N-methyltransferase